MEVLSQPITFIIVLKNNNVSYQCYEKFRESAKKYSWNHQIFWGTDGNTIDHNTWKSINLEPRLDKPTMKKPGVQGCFLSHWRLWTKCVEINSPMIILEHDAIIQDYFPKLLQLNENRILKLHRHFKQKRTLVDDDSGIYTPSSHAYIITPDQSKKMIEFSKQVGTFEVDRMLGSNLFEISHYGRVSLVERQGTPSTTQQL